MLNKKGFTLLELMIVVAIVGIMSGIALAVGPGMLTKSKIRSDIREVLGNMQKARMTAIKNNYPHTVLFNADHYLMWKDDGETLIGINPAQENDYIVNGEEHAIRVDYRPGVTLNQATFTTPLTPNGMRWLNKGMPEDGGTVIIRNQVYSFRVILLASGVMKLNFSEDNGTTWN